MRYNNVQAQSIEKQMISKYKLANVVVCSNYPKDAVAEMTKLKLAFDIWQSTILNFQAEYQYKILEKNQKEISHFSGEKLHLELKGIPMLIKDIISFTFS